MKVHGQTANACNLLKSQMSSCVCESTNANGNVSMWKKGSNWMLRFYLHGLCMVVKPITPPSIFSLLIT